MKKTFFTLVALVATLMVSCTTSQSQQDATNNETENNFKIQRGTNVSHWLSQSEERGEARRQHIQEDDFARLDSLGFAIKGTVLLMAFCLAH